MRVVSSQGGYRPDAGQLECSAGTIRRSTLLAGLRYPILGRGRSVDRHAAALEGKRALVTGGTSGIGLAVVRRFVAEGAEVVAIARRPRPEVAAAGASMIAADVADADQLEQAFDHARELLGDLDVVVLNAGISELDAGDVLGDDDAEHLRAQIEVNTMGVFHGIRFAGGAMRDGGSIAITSTAALAWPFPDYLTYAASKAPLAAMSTHAAMKLGPRGIRVNTVSPGTILTPMQPDDDPEARIAPLATCLGRAGTTDDVTGVYVFLASDDSRYVTATDIRVDGGWLGGLTYAEASALLDR
jgi:NAD(P)-dependent dehydrogenase (short-subunit alcohol dehydrogenase family)